MSDRSYILAIEPDFQSLERVRHWITTSGDCSAWWNHFPMVFIIESQLDTAAISDKLHALAPEIRFLLTRVDLADAQGWLPETSWKWIEKRALSGTLQSSARF